MLYPDWEKKKTLYNIYKSYIDPNIPILTIDQDGFINIIAGAINGHSRVNIKRNNLQTEIAFAHSGKTQWTDDSNFIIVKKGDKILWNILKVDADSNAYLCIEFIPFTR